MQKIRLVWLLPSILGRRLGSQVRTTSSGDLADKLMSDERKDKDVDGVGEPRRASGCTLSGSQTHPLGARVLSLVAQGLPNKEVADKLFVSVNTVKTHLSTYSRSSGDKPERRRTSLQRRA